MATAQELNDDVLTCSVCLKVFTDPCTLPCDHTFCGQCLVEYTKTKPEAIQAKSLSCPFCSHLTKVKDPNQPVEKWAWQFKSGILLQRLLEPFVKDGDNCCLCEKNGDKSPASFWCSDCDVTLCDSCHKVHSLMALTSHHTVTDLSGEVKVRGKRRVECPDHEDECVRFHCRDCKQALCQTCCIVSHRDCRSVVTMKSMMSEMRNTLKTRRGTLTKQMDTELQQVKGEIGQISQVHESNSSIRTMIRSATEAAISILREKERDLMKRLDGDTNNVLIQLNANLQNGDMAVKIHKQQLEIIDQALQTDIEIEVYEQYMSCDPDLKETRADSRQPQLTFFQDLKTLNNTLRDVSLGDVGFVDRPKVLRGSPKLKHTLECGVPGDKSDLIELLGDMRNPYINDIACLDVDGTETVVITDGNNSCVTSFFVKQLKRCHSRKRLESSPRRIAKLEENKIAISLPHSRRIKVLEVGPELILQSDFNTRQRYVGLTALSSSTLAAGAYPPSPSVDILDMSGNVLRCLCPLDNGQNIIKNPSFLCTTPTGNILISDMGEASVVCLTPRGVVIFHSLLKGDRCFCQPRGIRSIASGDILVVDRDEDKVILLSQSGEFVRDVLTSQHGLRHPYCIDIDRNGNVCVSCEDGDKHNIQVFTFK